VRNPSLIQNMIFKKTHRAAVCFLTFLVLMNGAILPAKAGDKATVELQCSTTKIVLTCTMFDQGTCIKSTLTFDTGAGAHSVFPAKKIPQNFTAPTIADSILCEKGNEKFAVYVMYSACPSDGCTFVRAYDQNGKDISVLDSDHDFHDYFGKDVRDLQLISMISLRGNR
jgi:hypothetical protein